MQYTPPPTLDLTQVPPWFWVWFNDFFNTNVPIIQPVGIDPAVDAGSQGASTSATPGVINASGTT